MVGASVNGAPRRKEYAAPLYALPRLYSQHVHNSVSRGAALAHLECNNALQSLCLLLGGKADISDGRSNVRFRPKADVLNQIERYNAMRARRTAGRNDMGLS